MKNNTHKILALKYRPKNFKELIGQNTMIETITNSIKLNKIPNAYLLTGIRGVGKTTTARLIAKSLNCKNGIENLCLKDMCEHCKGITNSNHIDVLEMDAASRTGIDDVRELIESSKYNPTSAKYKIIILDEVHMLSKQAFNGLLKTLEEPPPHLKFIFATTEFKKIPVTIVSRCQRFDLHRVSIDILFNNLKKISKNENAKITDEALKLIAKTSEGSVRDSLSILDRAIASQENLSKEIEEKFVRNMLGIADRSKMIELIKFIFQGDEKNSIKQLKQLVNEGIDPINFLNDFLEIIYFIFKKKNLGDFETDATLSQAEHEIFDSISKDIDVTTLMVFWQFILKGLDEIAIVANPILSLEMIIVRLIHLKAMPSYESVINSVNNVGADSFTLKKEDNINDFSKKNFVEEIDLKKIPKNQIKNMTQAKPELSSLNNHKKDIENKNENIKSFQDLIKLSSAKKEVELKYDLEKNVNLVKFSDGKIDISFNENLRKDFVRNLSEKLLEWTGKRWVITLTKTPGQKTYYEIEKNKKIELKEKEKKGDVYKKFKSFFDDIELIDVSEEK